MKIVICILAKNEERNIAVTLAELADQTLLRADTHAIDVHVVANGCEDETVARAQSARSFFSRLGRHLEVHDLHPGGKSRAWNRAVHDLVDPSIDILIFIDADIRFAHDQVLTQLIAMLDEDERRIVCSGHPVKDISAKQHKSVLDHFSLAVSGKSRHVGAITGQLYAARAAALREIWLPDETPGEDGFLNAMITTSGFTQPPDPCRVVTPDRPTHYFHAHTPRQFVAHERRMIIGTVINCWIFEHLWDLKLKVSAGPLIREWNETDPHWVDRLIQRRAKGRMWLVPGEVVFGRLRDGRSLSLRRLAYFPLALAATLLTLPPAVGANRRLMKSGAAATW